MKNKSILTITSLTFLILISCKKNYSCECNITSLTTTYYRKSEKKAKEACDVLNNQAMASDGSCTLK